MQIKATELFLFSFFEIKELISLFKTYSIIMDSNLPLIKDETSMFVWVQWSVSMAEISTFFYSRSCPIFQWRIQDFFKEANHQKFLSHSISNHNFLVR